MPQIERIVWTRGFKRAFNKRVLGKSSEKRFTERLEIFSRDPFDPRIKTHKLSGKLDDLWSFSVAFDCRVIFKFISDHEALLIDIGSHEEVY
jgi:mRNA-degrading endonuclease YafQ of YafQ-DinJ toxin-antitoxin module